MSLSNSSQMSLRRFVFMLNCKAPENNFIKIPRVGVVVFMINYDGLHTHIQIVCSLLSSIAQYRINP